MNGCFIRGEQDNVFIFVGSLTKGEIPKGTIHLCDETRLSANIRTEGGKEQALRGEEEK